MANNKTNYPQKTNGQEKPKDNKGVASSQNVTPKKKLPQRNEKGQFVKGIKKVENSGRKQGTPNRYGNIRDRLKNIILPYLNDDPQAGGNTLALDLQAIDDPNERVHAVAAILPFIVPKYSSTTISADTERPIAEEQRLLQLDKQYRKQTEVSVRTLTIVDNDNPASTSHLSPDDIKNLTSDEEEDE